MRKYYAQFIASRTSCLYPINLEFERERNSIAGDKFNFTRVDQGLAILYRREIE